MAPSVVAALLFASALLSSLSFLPKANAEGSSCITEYNPDANYFPFGYNSSDPFAIPLGQAIVSTSEKFSVQYNNSYKIVYSAISQSVYTLYQCGTPKPVGVPSSLPPIEVPTPSVAIDSTIILPYFELLGLLPFLSAADNSTVTPYATSPCFHKLVENGTIASYNLSTGFNGTVFTGLGNPDFVQFDASLDPGPLKRTEWLKYLAVFFNKEAEATILFDQITANYKCLNGSNKLSRKPVVAWTTAYEGLFNISNASYKLQLVLDAGGENLAPSEMASFNVSLPSDVSTLKSILKKIDVLIDENYAMDPSSYNLTDFVASLGDASSSDYPFMSSKNVWRDDRRIKGDSQGLDWYEGFLPQPQIALQEMLAIVNPKVTRRAYFFRNIAAGEGVVKLTSVDCTRDPTTALSPTLFACPVDTSAAPSSSPSITLSLLLSLLLVFALLL